MMKNLLLLVGLLIVAPYFSSASLRVFACEPEWASLAKEIGGEKVSTFSATHAQQNPHYIRARPSLIAKIRRADLLICSGAGLEVGWLPVLIQKASSTLQPGRIGYISASDHVSILEVPTVVDRSLGDIHPEGNPHVHYHPDNIVKVANVICERLCQLDAEQAVYYQKRLEKFRQRWATAAAIWKEQSAALKGKSVVVYHKNFSYLINWLEMKQVGSLEPKPGLPPTASHLNQLLANAETNELSLIILTPYENNKAASWLSSRTGSTVVQLPYTIGGDEHSDDLFSLYERTISLLNEAL
jgi:zinc/manganese transport system substrate-binding protein